MSNRFQRHIVDRLRRQCHREYRDSAAYGFTTVRKYDLQALVSERDRLERELANLRFASNELVIDIEDWTEDVQKRLGTKQHISWPALSRMQTRLRALDQKPEQRND